MLRIKNRNTHVIICAYIPANILFVQTYPYIYISPNLLFVSNIPSYISPNFIYLFIIIIIFFSQQDT